MRSSSSVASPNSSSEPCRRATISFIAFGPLALFLSAVYSEALFLALSAGTFHAARRGRWAWVGIVGGLAAMTRIAGFLMFGPALLMYYFGPRSDTEPMPVRSWWKPRYRVRPDLLWLVLIPAAAALVEAYLMIRGLGPSATVNAREKYSDHAIVFPLVGAWQGMVGAWHQLMNFHTGTYLGQEVFQLGSLLAGCVALVGVFRRLPLAYGAYVALDFLLHLSTPTQSDTLLGFDRYVSLRFPLFMWLGCVGRGATEGSPHCSPSRSRCSCSLPFSSRPGTGWERRPSEHG